MRPLFASATAADEGRDEALWRLGQELLRRGYRFTTVTPASHARVNARPENRWAQDLRGIFGWSRPFGEELLPDPLRAALEAAEALEPVPGGWRSRVRYSSLNGRLYVHSAYPTEAADAVFFGPDTYRFVAAIEHLLARRRGPIRRAVDIGCGAGPGAVSVALARPEAEVLGVDVNPTALRYTAINARSAGAGNVTPIASDLLHEVDGRFDLIVANPPYLNDPAQRAYRHGGGEYGAALSLAIVDAALPRLAPGGELLLYTGVAIIDGDDPFRAAVGQQLASRGFDWRYRELDPDVFGEELESGAYRTAERIAAVELIVQG